MHGIRRVGEDQGVIAVQSTHKKRLSTTIFVTVLSFSILVVAVVALAMGVLFHASYEKDAEDKILGAARETASQLDSMSTLEQVVVLRDQLGETVRYTLISPSGDVLYDSTAPDQNSASSIGNHADRPEVQSALVTGAGMVTRYSETLKNDTIYAAVRLDSGDVLRLSETRESLFSFMHSLIIPLVIILIGVVIMVVFFSRLLTRRIMAPLNGFDADEGLGHTSYLEMDPLLGRIEQQQQQLREQNRELMRAEDMRRAFSANVSHEMKTPLQVIAGYSELLSTGMVSAEDTVKFACIIHEESQHMYALIDDVLALSRLDEPVSPDGLSDSIDLHALAESVVERLRPLAEKHEVSLRVEGQDGQRVLIDGNEPLMEQVMTNLVSNAIRYNRPGGEVVVVVDIESAPAVLERCDKEAGADEMRFGPRSHVAYPIDFVQAVVRVMDTGVGISPDEQQKIFERFYRVDKSRSKETGGTGLGLAIVKHAVEHHNGSIEVESEFGKGSVFSVRFPLKR